MDLRINEQTRDVLGSQRKEGLIGGFSAGIPALALVTAVHKDGTMSTHSIFGNSPGQIAFVHSTVPHTGLTLFQMHLASTLEEVP